MAAGKPNIETCPSNAAEPPLSANDRENLASELAPNATELSPDALLFMPTATAT